MQFSVIYSADWPKSDGYVRKYAPPHARRWTLTEGDECYDYAYLEGDWAHGRHRKWCALLSRAEFDEFVRDTGLYMEDVQTMGSLGAPGFGVGWSPAVSFRADDDYDQVIRDAYVTPIPTAKPSEGRAMERDWERIYRAMLTVYQP